MLPAAIKKKKKSNYVPSDYNFQSSADIQISNHMFKQKRDCKTIGEMGQCKTKAIQADLGTFMHIQTYPDIFRNYSANF